jgi:iron complex outermembrane receptor protein
MNKNDIQQPLIVGLMATTIFMTFGPTLALAQDQRDQLRRREPGAQAPIQLAPADRIFEFNIPTKPLAEALADLSATTGFQVRYPDQPPSGLTSSPVIGSYTAMEAIQRLLAGTGLAARLTDTNTVTIEQGAAQRDPSGRVELETTTVLGSRRPDVPLSNVPSSITVVDREVIQKEQVTTNRIEDVISRTVPGFNPTNNGVRQIRGRTAQVFVNGVPTNEALRASSGSDLNLLGADQLAGIEVARGANSAYGFGSPGGIIALSTPRAESEELTVRTRLRASFSPQHPGGSYQPSLYLSASQIVKAFDYHLGGLIAYDGSAYDPNGALAFARNVRVRLGQNRVFSGGLDGSFGLNLAEYGALRLTGTFGYDDFIDGYRTIDGVYRKTYARSVKDPAADQSFRDSYTLNLSYENTLLGHAIKLEGFASDIYTEFYSTEDGAVFRDEQTNEYQGFRSSITTPLDFVLRRAAVTYGFDFIRNRYFRPFFNDDTGEFVTFFSSDVTLYSYAPYGQLELPIRDFLVTGGLRHEIYRGSAETVGPGCCTRGGDIDGFDLTLFNAGLVYFLQENAELYFTFSQGSEISQLSRAARTVTSIDQLDPQPAKSNQYEGGVRGDWASLSWSLAGFYTESDLLSALQTNPLDPEGPLIPLREPREFWGIEATAGWRMSERWGLSGVFTWMEGDRETSTGETRPISSLEVPPILMTTNLDYSPFPWARVTLQLNYRGKRDPFGDSTEFDEGRVEDLWLVNASTSFAVGRGELQVGVENLLNKKYVSIAGEAFNGGFGWGLEEGTRLAAAYSVKWR